jgi:flagellar biosynthesis regulator FlbT
MTKLTPIEGRTLVSLDDLPQPSTEERLENLARELMTAASMLRGAELRDQLCQVETVERAKRALQAGAAARTHLRAACELATVAEVCDNIAALIDSTSQRGPEDGYSAALTTDVGSLQPSRGALEAACRRLRITAMFRPKIPEVLEAVREAEIMYAAALRAIDELPGQIARAEHAHEQAKPL